MNTFLDYLTVLAVAALLLAPALYGALHDHRTDRQLAEAARARSTEPRPAPAPRRTAPRPAPWRRGRVAH
ncbi:hypothetical protein QEZ40_003414 [Streptomyces katrae]|uniref:Uncharacterized protein n=1 Tax=Streptomyces katrae TaxID=68223 RepID=A0ABT7GMG6_9ACTN|nr:hypothetical protein [Streptomyces katrae]MDK9494780.1 hypothetical protein [Streptomyces katrae]